MTTMLNRYASVVVGPSAQNGIRINDVGFEGPTGLFRERRRQLRVRFEVRKTSTSEPNPARISIYNMNETSRRYLENEKDFVVALDVGYSGLVASENPVMSQLYLGDIARVGTRREGPDVVTTIEAGEGERSISEASLDKSYGAGTSTPAVIKDLADALGFKLSGSSAQMLLSLATSIFSMGHVATGTAAAQMDAILKPLGAEWHVADNELVILSPTGQLLEPAVVLGSDSGLIGIPSIGKPHKTKKEAKDAAPKSIVEFTALINPGIRPGRAVVLKPPAAALNSGPIQTKVYGTFRVRRVDFSGDTHGQDWYAKGEAV